MLGGGGVWRHAPGISDLLISFLLYILVVKLQKLDDLMLNLVVVFEARRIRRKSASGRRGCKAAGYPRKARENKRSHTDSILPSLAAEGAMHE